jgi:hypothetical protein
MEDKPLVAVSVLMFSGLTISKTVSNLIVPFVGVILKDPSAILRVSMVLNSVPLLVNTLAGLLAKALGSLRSLITSASPLVLLGERVRRKLAKRELKEITTAILTLPKPNCVKPPVASSLREELTQCLILRKKLYPFFVI